MTTSCFALPGLETPAADKVRLQTRCKCGYNSPFSKFVSSSEFSRTRPICGGIPVMAVCLSSTFADLDGPAALLTLFLALLLSRLMQLVLLLCDFVPPGLITPDKA